MSQVKIDGARIKELHAQGLSRKEISKETGYPMKAVNMAFNALGLKREKVVYVIETDAVTTNEVTNETVIETEDSDDLISINHSDDEL